MLTDRFRNFFGKRFLNKKNFSNENVVIFVVCISIATMFWSLTKLSKSYSSTLSVPIRYTNMPKDSVLTHTLPEFLSVTVEAPGWNLLVRHMKLYQSTLTVDLQLFKTTAYLATNDKTNLISGQFPSDFNVIRIHPDTINFDMDSRLQKKIPIKLNYTIDFEKQYDQSAPAFAVPDSVLIIGPKSKIEVFEYWSTQERSYEQVNKSIRETVELEIPQSPGINLSFTETELNIPVEQITEDKTEINITVIPPNNKRINVIHMPQKVTVTYKVALSNYERVGSNLFEAVVDFSDMDLMNNNTAAIVLTRTPDFIKSADFYPKRVQYIINQ